METEELACLHCGRVMHGITCLTSEGEEVKLKPGDGIGCAACHGLMVVTDDLAFRKMDEEEEKRARHEIGRLAFETFLSKLATAIAETLSELAEEERSEREEEDEGDDRKGMH